MRLETRGGRQISPARLGNGDLVAIRTHTSYNERTNSKEGVVSFVSEGVIIAMDATGMNLSCDDILPSGKEHISSFAVVKLASDVTHKRYTKALQTLKKAASDSDHPANALVRVLFEDLVPQYEQQQMSHEILRPFLDTLNSGQVEAVLKALHARDIAVIHGPPGTGKTHTLVAYILAEVKRGRRVLAVAPSNVAVDNIAERLATVSKPPKFLRAGHPARMIPNVEKHSLDCLLKNSHDSRIVDDIRQELDAVNSKRGMERDKKVRKDLRYEAKELRKELRRRERAAVERLLGQMQVVLSTISGAGARILDIAERSEAFDVVVVDEAAQALEASCWVPLLRSRKVVLAGDPYQLSGTVKSPLAERKGLKRSILDRIFSCTSLKGTISMLKTQYRMNRLVADWSSDEFYDGQLVSHDSVAEHTLADLVASEPSARNVPIWDPFIAIDTAGGDCEEDSIGGQDGIEQDMHRRNVLRPSRANSGEAKIVQKVVRDLIAVGVDVRDIGVLSPYSGQVELLRKLIWKDFDRKVEVATVDSFQGREKEVVVMSLVRSNEAGEVGFLSDERRLNVAITRARRCVIIVCDSETICTDPFLARIIEYAENCGHIRSAVTDFPEIVGTYSQFRRPKEAIDAEKRTEKAKKKRSRRSAAPGSNRIIGKKGEVGYGDGYKNRREERIQMTDEIRGQIEAFINDKKAFEKIFSPNLNAWQRLLVHEIAEEKRLFHKSYDTGKNRSIRVRKLGYKQQGETCIKKEEEKDESSGASNCAVEEIEEASKEFSIIRDLDDHHVQGDEEAEHGEDSGKVDYSETNKLLRDLHLERQLQSEKTEENQNSVESNFRMHKTREAGMKKRRGNRKGSASKSAQEEDFDSVLAKYGATNSAPASSSFSAGVNEIVNDRSSSSVSERSGSAEQAKKRLEQKLSTDSSKRKKKSRK